MGNGLIWYDAGKLFPPFDTAFELTNDECTIFSEEVLCMASDHTVSRGQYLVTLNKDGEIHGEWGSDLCETNDDAPIVAWAFIPEEEDDG